jgi:hypothetical protein
MPVHLEIRIGGGYALVGNRGLDRFDVASVTPTQPQHVHHALRVTLVKGSSVPTAPSAPAFWDLETGPYRMEVWPGGAAPKGRITPPGPEDRKMFIPDVPVLGRSALASDWRERLAARITLRAGRLLVDRRSLARGEFEFRHPTLPPTPRQKLPDGRNGFVYTLSDYSPDVNSVTLALFPLATTDHAILAGTAAPTASYVITPDSAASVELQADSAENEKTMRDGMDLTEFGIFYNLLEPVPSISDQYIPRWFAGSVPRDAVSMMSPGSECPLGIYDDNTE